ncbi:MAG TPA: SRPBCC family protein [Marmoricola sp.]
MRGSVTVQMAASPEVVWDLVSDVTRIGEFSPETFEARWTRGATGPEVGAYFKGHVRRNEVGPVYWTLCRVTECAPGRDFGFVVEVRGQDVNHWRYQLHETITGTAVTESFELAGAGYLKAYWAVLGRLRGRRNERDMRRTLERIKVIAERTEAAR